MYNYIIIDSAPCAPVSDTLNIIQHSDITVYLTKSNITSKKAIKFIDELSKSKIKNQLALILNGISKDKGNLYNYGYGYGYGYGYNYKKKQNHHSLASISSFAITDFAS